MMHENPFQEEDGNILFLILIAVALFAALSYAVSQSNRSGGADITQEKAQLIASDFMSLFSQVDSALTRLQVSNNCTDAEIGFDFTTMSNSGAKIVGISTLGDGSTTDQASYGLTSGDQWGYNRRADGTCDIFGTNGGNVAMTISQTATSELTMWGNFPLSLFEITPFPAQNLTSTKDLQIGIWADASITPEVNSFRPVCERINQLAAVPFPSTSSGALSWAGAGNGEFWGKRTFCLFEPPANVVLIHIIAER